jgi:hypothetical protein
MKFINMPLSEKEKRMVRECSETQQERIMQWIDDHQNGKSGIYPYRVAQDVCMEFKLEYREAIQYVLDHIKTVMAKNE